ncbi:hypothetical protein SAMN05444157_2396 [Frankineae bacterium MT45]|nr:hypothetical protein SAMN05444157_2396 [Frankineae bacterium MT45]
MSTDSHELVDVTLRARNVAFDWSKLPLHYVPDEPFVTHWANVMHMLLPAGERWFVEVFTQALPLIRDDRLREDVLGFIGQESTHATAHQGAQDHLRAQGLDTTRYVGELEWFFEQRLGNRDLTGKAAEEWLVERLSLIASIEHLTAVLGDWILNSHGLDEAGADPTMLDLLRWHGAEEVEHRSVAFDLYMHVDGRYRRRVRSHVAILPALIWLWSRGIRRLMASDPMLAGTGTKPHWRDWTRAGRLNLLPGPTEFLRSYRTYFKRSYHPSQECSTSQAVAYLATSPAALAAAD